MDGGATSLTKRIEEGERKKKRRREQTRTYSFLADVKKWFIQLTRVNDCCKIARYDHLVIILLQSCR
jgi:hypothetical protein